MAGDPGAAATYDCGRTPESVSDSLILPEQWEQICGAIAAGHNTLVLSEAGTLGDFPRALRDHFSAELAVALVTYKGSGKRFFVDLAEQLDIPTSETKFNKDGEPCGEKDLSMDALKDEILSNLGDRNLLIFPEAKRLTTGIRYWLEDAIAAASSPLWMLLGWKYWLALWVGHVVSCFSDTFTKKGVQLFWPQPVWCVCGLNPNRRLSTGGAGEYWVLAIAVGLLLLNFKLTSAGGIVKRTSEAFNLRPNMVQLYNQTAASQHVWAEVTGVWSSDRTRADGRYFILGNQGSEFVLSDGRTVFKTGDQLVVERLKVQPGNPATLQVLTARTEDELGEVLGQLERTGAAVFLSGELVVDAGEALVVPVMAKGMETIAASEGRVRLKYARLEEVIRLLRDEYISGSITVRVITPSPWD